MKPKLRSCERKSLARAHAEFYSPKVLAASAFGVFSKFAPAFVVAAIALLGLSAYADGSMAHMAHTHGTHLLAGAGLAGLVGVKSPIHALRQKKNDLTIEQRKLLDTARSENRELTEPEAAKFDDNIKALVTIEKNLEREEHVLELEKGMKPMHDENERAATAASKFSSFGEFLKSVVIAGRSNNHQVDPRLVQAAASGTSEGVPADGGFLVATDYSNELLNKAYSTGILASKVTRIPISANSNGIKLTAIDETSRATGSRWGGVQVFWAAEADAATAKKPKFRRIDMELKKLIGLCYATDELLQDSTALEAVINKAFPEEFGFVLDDAIIRGDGAGSRSGFCLRPV
jgi:HK97 family phage major capsid protein